MPSPELQSPASWMWKPNSPFGRRPLTLATTCTLPLRCSKVTVPLTVLPLVGSRFAVALGPPPIMLCIVSHPASNATTATNKGAGFMSGFLRGGPLYSFLGSLGRRHGYALAFLVVGH